MDDSHFSRLERMYTSAPVNAYYRPRLTISNGAADLVLPMRPEFFHAAGAVHGCVYFKAMDDAAFFAANSVVTDVMMLTVSFNVHFTRPIRDGEMRATGRLVHRSRRIFLAEATVEDARGRPIARGTGTFMKSRTPLSAEIGYG